MNPLFCDCCGDNVKAVYPCKFVFHDGYEIPFNICLDCMDNETLSFKITDKRRIAKIVTQLINLNKWRKRRFKK